MSLINREVLLAEYDRVHVGPPGGARKLMEDAPTIELRCEDCESFNKTRLLIPQPQRKTGRWIPQDHNKSNGMASTLVFYYPKCSECGHSGNYDMNFCPNCGADMRGDDDE